jgi:uncharacterized FlaG/YvyC family protein
MINTAESGYLRPFMPDGRRGRNFENVGLHLNSARPDGAGDDETEHFNAGGDSLKAEIANLEQISLAFNKKLQFVIDYGSKEITINVIDPDTDKVIKVLPPEELRRLHNKIEEAIGFLFDEKV